VLRKKLTLLVASITLISLIGISFSKVLAQTSRSANRAKAPQTAEGNTAAAEKPYDWKASFAKVSAGNVPHLPDGKPDLQGIWSFSILTPLNRPGGDTKTEITVDEAQEVEDAAQKAQIGLRIEPTVTPPGEKTTDAYNSFWRDGYWYKVPMTTLHTSQVVDPPNGRVPPLTPDAKQRARIATAKRNRPATGPEDRPTTSRCVATVRGGPPIIGDGPGAQETTMQIVQGPDVVEVRQDHGAQMVYLDGRARPPDSVHLDKGVSRGHWEGDTLVVESTNFAPWGLGNFDAYGTTDQLHIAERWKRLDDTHLLYGFTIDDPGTWTKPWSVEYVMWRMTNQEELVEYACQEGNVGIHFTLTAAREREKEEAETAEKADVKAISASSVATAAPIHPSIAPTAIPFESNALGMEFAMIPPGEFQMGCSPDAKANECDKDEKPLHPVQITKAFEIQRTEVTQKLWQELMGSNPSFHKGDLQFPVEQISFHEVQTFLAKLNERNDGYRYRLPSEAEWEYVVRAGTTDQYAGPLQDLGTLTINLQLSGGAFGVSSTRPVAGQMPNAWGLYDTRGNVKEWVQDWYDPSYYSDSPVADPKGPATGELRTVRGASFRVYARQTYPWLIRVSVRSKFPDAYQGYDVGFRVLREKIVPAS